MVFITLHMLIMVGSFGSMIFHFGGKVSGPSDRIYIEDKAEILTDEEEQEVLELLNKVYDQSGMPVTVHTDNFDWRQHYNSIEVYSEELYYQIGFDEESMLVLFTSDMVGDFYDWEYDMYCGDDTTKCLSDNTFDKLLANFHKGMASENLAEALEYAWSSVLPELGKTGVDWSMLPVLPFLLFFYGIFYVVILGGTRKQNEAYRYFKQHPEQLSKEPMVLYSECPNCGAPNTMQKEVCPYCESLLKISDDNVKFVEPKR